MTQHVAVFGHSHVWAIRRAIGAINPPIPGMDFTAPLCGTSEMPGPIVVRDAKDRPHLTATLTALLNRLRQGDTLGDTWLLSMAQGNHYNQFGMVSVDGSFDFVLDGYEDLPLEAGATLLPARAVARGLEGCFPETSRYLTLLSKTAFEGRVLIGGPPPPPRDEAPILALLQSKPSAADAPTERVSPAFVRLKLWHLQNRLFEDLCRRNGLVYVSGAFLEGQDSDGFLLPEFVKDAVHANHHWAVLYLRKIATQIKSAKETADA